MRMLLLQVRNPDDPMRSQEVDCFAGALGVAPERIETWDVLRHPPETDLLDAYDVLFFGGSGHYSARGDEPWMLATLEFLRGVARRGHPTFASCWGFQALGRALGGTLIHDASRAEVGSHRLTRTEEAAADPLFAQLPRQFTAQLGHRDHLVDLPPGAVRLAFSQLTANQAYLLPGKPIYATQFHPELTEEGLRQRLETYPDYVDSPDGNGAQRVLDGLRPSTESNQLLRRFIEHVFGPDALQAPQSGRPVGP